VSEFLPALAFTLPQEGGYANDPVDAGGETYRGVARNKHPEWEGWPIVDDLKAWPGFPHNLAGNAEIQDMVVKFYQRSFWNPLLAQIKDQAIANKIFDLGVNEGQKEITLITQRACNDCGQETEVDGKLGSATIKSINAADPDQLMKAIKINANLFYDQIEKSHPSWKKRFDHNWRKRVNA
jgi:lysozyme family protein